MKLSALALWIGLGAMVGACAPTDAGGQRIPADFNFDWVVYDDDSGEISALPTGMARGRGRHSPGPDDQR
jgi:hypothetical protein